MERSVAIKKLGKLLGKSLGYRVDPKAPDQETRYKASADLPAANAVKKSISERMDAHRQAILQADPEYQQLKADYEVAKKVCDGLFSITCRYKITVGTTSSMFFHVKAQGDSWEDVIGQLTKSEGRLTHPRTYRPEVEALRGIAALSVVFEHTVAPATTPWLHVLFGRRLTMKWKMKKEIK